MSSHKFRTIQLRELPERLSPHFKICQCQMVDPVTGRKIIKCKECVRLDKVIDDLFEGFNFIITVRPKDYGTHRAV